MTLIGTAPGVLLAWKRSETADIVTVTGVLFFGSPPFWVAMTLIILFSPALGWLPSLGAYKLGTSVPNWNGLVDVRERPTRAGTRFEAVAGRAR